MYLACSDYQTDHITQATYNLHDSLLSVVVVLIVELLIVLDRVVEGVGYVKQLLITVLMKHLHLFLLVLLATKDLAALFL